MKLAVVIVAAWLITLLQTKVFRFFWQRGLSVKLKFCQPAAVEGETAQLKEIITNRKYLPLPVLHVKFQMGKYLIFTASNNFKITDQNYRSDIFSCMPWQEIRRTLDFTCKKRGYYRIDHIDLVSYDLFFLAHFVSALPEDTFMYVYPGPADPVRLTLPLKNLMGQILARQALLRDPFETQGIRPYQSYDPYKNINWKATAHTGGLQVNVFTPASSWQVVILLDTDSDRVWGDDGLTEESIRLCGSIAQYMIEQGIPVAVYSNGTDCLSQRPSRIEAGAGQEHLKSIMELLARLQFASKTPLSAAALKALAGVKLMSPEYAERDGLGGYDSTTAPENSSIGTAPAPADHAATEAPSDGSYLPMENLISFLAEGGNGGYGSDSSVYVLISPVQRDSLSREFDSLCLKSPGSQWILPRRPDDKLSVTCPKHGEIYEWEVSYGRTQII